MLVFACLAPHPPIILPSVGSSADRKKVKKTILALEKLGEELAETKPDLIIISSPHPDWGVNVPLHFLISKIKNHPSSTESRRGREKSKIQFKIQNYQSVDSKFVIHNSRSAIYPLLTTLDSPKQHFLWGRKIAAEIPDKLRFAWIASGDMSHRLKKSGPYGLHPSGAKFDLKFIDYLKKKDIKGILNLDPKLIEEAGECGLRSFCMLLGALGAQKPRSAWKPKILSYEKPFGVGYLVSRLV